MIAMHKYNCFTNIKKRISLIQELTPKTITFGKKINKLYIGQINLMC